MPVWKQIKSKIIHRNPWFVLKEDDVIRPDGKPGKYYYIDNSDSVSIIAVDHDGGIYLVGQTRYTADNAYSWEVIGGSYKKGESSLQKAKEELREEAGVKAEKIIKIGNFFEANGCGHLRVTVYLATKLQISNNQPEPTEDIKVKKFFIKEIESKILNGEIFDSFSITSLYIYKLYR